MNKSPAGRWDEMTSEEARTLNESFLSRWDEMTLEEVRTLWFYGGYGTRDDFPGIAAALFRMVRGVTRRARRSLAEHFASLAVRRGVRAALALLAVVLRVTERPAVPSRMSGRTVRRLLPQAGHGALAPVRGSPPHLRMCPVMPGAPPM